MYVGYGRVFVSEGTAEAEVKRRGGLCLACLCASACCWGRVCEAWWEVKARGERASGRALVYALRNKAAGGGSSEQQALLRLGWWLWQQLGKGQCSRQGHQQKQRPGARMCLR